MPALRQTRAPVAGGEDDRDATRSDALGQFEHRFTGKIDIENGDIRRRRRFQKLDRARQPHRRADDPASKIGEHILEVERHQGLVLDNEHADILQLIAVVVHCLARSCHRIPKEW